MKEIVQEGEAVLRQIAPPVPEEAFGSPELVQLIEEMSGLLDAQPEGVALAAPQVGVSWRLFIVRMDRVESADEKQGGVIDKLEEPRVEAFINPEIIKSSRKRADADEGCLSVRGIYGTTLRHERMTIRARRPDGSSFERGAGGLLAQIFQHEIDHLNGILFIDHAKNLMRVVEPAHKEPFVFFGTPSVARDTLRELLARGFTPSLVVTSPDAAAGRGLAITPSPVKRLALTHDLPVATPATLEQKAIEHIQSFNPAYAVVVAYGKLFPEPLIGAFPKGVLNVHYSLLPKYRGATPLEAALLAGEAETGVTIQKMVKELDAGDILAQSATAIGMQETARELRPRLVTLGVELLTETLPRFERGELTPTPQPKDSPTPHARKLKKEDGELALDAPPEQNWRKYRAYADTIGTYFFDHGKRVKITDAVYEQGAFVIRRVIPEGKHEIFYADYLRSVVS